MKRFSALLLTAILLFSAFSLTVSARENTVEKQNVLSRRDFVSALAELNGITDDAVEWAYSRGLIIGNENGDLMPDDLITREQASIIVDRYLALCGIYGASIEGMPLYSDDSTIAEWARVAVYHMTAYGFLPSGIGNNFVPQGTLTLEEAFVCIERLSPLAE